MGKPRFASLRRPRCAAFARFPSPKNPMLYAADDDGPDGEKADTAGALPLSYAELAPADGTRTRDHLVTSEEAVSYAAVRPAA